MGRGTRTLTTSNKYSQEDICKLLSMYDEERKKKLCDSRTQYQSDNTISTTIAT